MDPSSYDGIIDAILGDTFLKNAYISYVSVIW